METMLFSASERLSGIDNVRILSISVSVLDGRIILIYASRAHGRHIATRPMRFSAHLGQPWNLPNPKLVLSLT